MPATELNLTPDSKITVKKNQSVEVQVQTDADDFQANAKTPDKVEITKEQGKIVVRGLAPTETDIDIEFRATAAGSDETVKVLKAEVQDLPETELSMNPENIDDVKVDEEVTSTATTNADTVNAESTNPEIATVTVEGKNVKFRGKSKGRTTATIRATAADSKEKVVSMNVNVSEKTPAELPEIDLTVDPTTVKIKKGEEKILNINTSGNYEMSTDEQGIAAVDQAQKKIIGKEKGTTKVHVIGRKEGNKDKQIDVNVTVTDENEETGDPSKSNINIKTKNVKGFVGDEVILNIESDTEVFIQSSNPNVCYVKDMNAKKVVLGKEGHAELLVQPVGASDNKVQKIQVDVTIKNYKDKKASYTLADIKDYLVSKIRIEEGFVPGKEEQVIQQLNKNSAFGANILHRGIEDAYMKVVDYQSNLIYIQFYIKRAKGRCLSEGKYEEAKTIDLTEPIAFTSFEVSKNDLMKLHLKFQELITKAYTN